MSWESRDLGSEKLRTFLSNLEPETQSFHFSNPADLPYKKYPSMTVLKWWDYRAFSF